MQRRLFLFAADFRKTGSAEVFLSAALRARSGICDVCRNMCESCVCRQAQWTFHGLTEFTTFWKNVSGVGKNRRVFPLSPYLMPWRALRLRCPCWMSRPILRRGFFCRVELDQIRFRGGCRTRSSCPRRDQLDNDFFQAECCSPGFMHCFMAFPLVAVRK